MGVSGKESSPGRGDGPRHRSRGGSMRGVLQEQQGAGFGQSRVSEGERVRGEVKKGM